MSKTGPRDNYSETARMMAFQSMETRENRQKSVYSNDYFNESWFGFTCGLSFATRVQFRGRQIESNLRDIPLTGGDCD